MASIVDPLGTPDPVYNRSGTSIVPLTGNGTSALTATQIVAVSGHTIVLATTTDTDFAFLLPANADIGDLVEIYPVSLPLSSNNPVIYPASGDTVRGGTASSVTMASNGSLFRKTNSTNWMLIQSVP